ncbi:hypothetical protein [Klugiella xanthotipulae]|uniref:Uncharacterized protein n=1 Tax=Klugiella xanthotipulae TaxID=244735 RepID=A0A543HYS3_9MICO|nr:hypothetical protein [Klugiella xanthotipulae]TQM63503.1 hypothetical protein FB466_1768 [Klugiella xanthotipulae]
MSASVSPKNTARSTSAVRAHSGDTSVATSLVPPGGYDVIAVVNGGAAATTWNAYKLLYR